MDASLHQRKRLSPWAILGAIALILLLLALTPVMLYVIWSSRQAQRVEELVAQIKARGEPATVQDLQSAFPLPTGQEDVTALWIEAMAPLDAPEFLEASKSIDFVGSQAPETPPELGLPWEGLEAAEQFLLLYRPTMEKSHEAARRGGRARFPTDYSKGFETLLPHAQKTRTIARMLRLELEVHSHRGDASAAAQSIRTLLVLPRCVEREPTLVSQLVAIAIQGVADEAIAAKVCLVPFTAEDLRAFQSLLRSRSTADNMRVGMLGERAMGHSVMRDPRLFGADRPGFRPFHRDVAMHLEYMGRFLDALDRGFPEGIKESTKIEDDFKRESHESFMLLSVYSTLILPANTAALQATARAIATTSAADAGIAVELFRRETGELPKTLEDLVPKYLPAAPIDPFDGSPMRFKLDETGFTIYSVGRNGADDGGALDKTQSDVGLFFPLKPK